MKKFKITQGEKIWLFIQLENAVAVYEANQDENARGQVFKTMEEAIFNIFAEKEKAANVSRYRKRQKNQKRDQDSY